MPAPATPQQQLILDINNLAAQIKSESDARSYVERLATILSPRQNYWAAAATRERIARAEYAAVSDRAALISEQRMADSFNRFVEGLGAPSAAHVTSAEIHEVREAMYESARALSRDNQIMTLWTMPNVFATGPNGHLAESCRPIEALQVLSLLYISPANLSRARRRIAGALSGDTTERVVGTSRWVLASTVAPDSLADGLRAAEDAYVRQHGTADYQKRLSDMFSSLLS